MTLILENMDNKKMECNQTNQECLDELYAMAQLFRVTATKAGALGDVVTAMSAAASNEQCYRAIEDLLEVKNGDEEVRVL